MGEVHDFARSLRKSPSFAAKVFGMLSVSPNLFRPVWLPAAMERQAKARRSHPQFPASAVIPTHVQEDYLAEHVDINWGPVDLGD